MQGYKIVGWLGALVLVLGIFMPARLIGMVRYISYFTDQRNQAIILMALIVIAVVLLYTDSAGKLLPVALIVLLCIEWTYQHRGASLLELERGFDSLTASAAANPMIRSATTLMGANSIWWILLAGGTLLAISGLLAPRTE